MEDKKKNFDLNQFKKKEDYPSLEQHANTPPQLISEYQAFEENKRGRYPRFRIVDKKGISYGFSYAYLTSWVFDSPTLLTLSIAEKVVTIEGSNLKRLEMLFLEEKVKTIREYNPTTHKAPSQSQAIIDKIEIH